MTTFVPCPACHGKGEFVIDSIPDAGDVTESCVGCGGSGAMADYKRRKAEEHEREERDREYICAACGHGAVDHYRPWNSCGFIWRTGACFDECACTESRESVVAKGVHTLYRPGLDRGS